MQKEVEQLTTIDSSLEEVGSGIGNPEFLKEDNLLTLRRRYFFNRMHRSKTPVGRIIQTPVASKRTNLLDVSSSVCIGVGQIDKMRKETSTIQNQAIYWFSVYWWCIKFP